MKYSTKARFDYMEKLIQSVGENDIKKELLYILESIKTDIDNNYAEISKPIRLYPESGTKRE